MRAMRDYPIFAAPVGGKHALLALAGGIFGLGLAIGTMFDPALSLRAPSIAAAFSRPRFAAPAPRPFEPDRVYVAEVVRVIDGDTFEARVSVWPGLVVDTKVRLRNIDAPELHARCADELKRAVAARTALQTMLASGGVMISQVGLDKYAGRVDALVMTHAAADVSTALLSGGYARAYNGGRRMPWCY
jgi:micrococcal nuclease